MQLGYDKELRELTDLWAEKLEATKREASECYDRRQEEIEELNSQLKSSKEDVSKLLKELEGLKSSQRLWGIKQRQVTTGEPVTQEVLSSMLQDLRTSLLAEVLDKSTTSEGNSTNRNSQVCRLGEDLQDNNTI